MKDVLRSQAETEAETEAKTRRRVQKQRVKTKSVSFWLHLIGTDPSAAQYWSSSVFHFVI